MVEQAVFRVEAVVAAALAVVCVVVLDMSPKAARWERSLRGVAVHKNSRTTLEPTLAEPQEAVVVAVVAHCGVDTACPKRRVLAMATLFSDTRRPAILGNDRRVLFLVQR